MGDVARIHSQAEQSLFAAFDAAGLEGGTRAASIEALKTDGLPTRRVESFHYTDLRARLRGDFKVAPKPANDVARSAGAAFPRLVPDASVQHFRDGHHVDFGEDVPADVTVREGVPSLDIAKGVDDTLLRLNDAFAQGGVSITVEDGANVERVIGLAHTPTAGEGTLAAMRWTIDAGAGSSSRFIERGVGPNGEAYLSSTAVQVNVGAGATVDYVISNEEGDAATRLARFSARLAKDATLNLFVLNAGGHLVRQEVHVEVAGEGAHLGLRGVNLVGGDSHVDVTTVLHHRVPHTTAEETFRNVCVGEGKGVFQGRINVNQPAQKTDAQMSCRTLLLSDDAEFNAKPELEIFADDVVCAHGATVADIEDAYIFYLRSRGISEARARQMLTRAFVAEVVEELEDDVIVEALERRIDAWMEANI